MTRYFTLLFLLCCFTVANAQSNNVSLLGNWDDNSLIIASGVQYNDIWGYAADGKEFAIIGSQQKIHFLDVTDPSQITEIAAITGGDNAIWRDMKTYGTHAYSVADQGSEGLLVFDLSNITNNTNPSVTLVDQQNSLFSRAHNIFVDTDHGFLYVVGSNASNSDLLIYDLNTTPGSPTLLQSVDLPGNYIHDIYVKDHIAYCSHEGRGLFVYNLCGITAAPCNEGVNGTFVELGRIDTYQFQGYNHSSWVKGNTIIFADETHGSPMTSADISDWDDIQIQDYFQSNKLGVSNPTSSSGPVPHNPFIIGNLLVVSYYHDGVLFYDISDPANVVEVGYYDTYLDNTTYSGFDGCWGTYPYLPSGHIIASDVLNGLHVLEMDQSLIDLAQSCTGTVCDDGDPNTYNDMLDANCVCVGTPCVASVITDLSASNIGPTSVTLNWSAVPGTTYDLRYRQIGTSTWINVNGITGTTAVVNGLNTETAYEAQIRSVCASSSSSYSSSTNFTTTAVQLNYCASQGNNVSDEYIGRVQLADIDNTSGAAGYSDHTNISTDLTSEGAYTITVTPVWTGTVYNESYSAWIDYNQDGDFDDSGEQLWTQGNTQASSVSGNFTVPASAALGGTRMRVSMKYNSLPSSCETFTYGEVEDYTVVIVSASCPDAGTACDDGDASTFNDIEDGNCGCAGTPCPTAGTTCDDGNASTFNDMEDGNCNCIGTACPTAGTNCDDGNASTENDVEDGNCNCAGTPCPSAGTTCDDGDASTFNDVEDGNCGCVGTPCPTAGTTCDDGDPNTENDVADGNCGCVGTPIGGCTYVTINNNDFESGWGIWNDGGSDCRRSANDATYANGTYCARLRDNTSTSVMSTDNLDLTSYDELTVDFSYYARSMDNSNEDFWLQISTNGGSTYTTVEEWNRGDEFENNARYNDQVVINGPFTSTTRLRFRCDASGNSDWVYIDDVVITGCQNGSSFIDNDEATVANEEPVTTESLSHNNPETILAPVYITDVKLAPNPTRDLLNVSFLLEQSGEVKLFVTNLAGQLVLEQNVQAEAGEFKQELNTASYEAGVYFLTVLTKDGRISRKFVVID